MILYEEDAACEMRATNFVSEAREKKGNIFRNCTRVQCKTAGNFQLKEEEQVRVIINCYYEKIVFLNERIR